MSASGGGDRPVLVTRRSFQADSPLNIALGMCLMVGVLILAIFNFREGFSYWFFFVFTLLFGFIALAQIAVGFDRARAATVEISRKGLRHHVKGKLVAEFEWSRQVTVDVRTNAGWESKSHGPLAGITFCDGKSLVEIDTLEAWRIKDIRRIWRPVAGIVRDMDVEIGDELREYLEIRAKRGLDRTARSARARLPSQDNGA